MVVFYLHGQTGRFTVWANGKQNSGLVNFIPELRLPFVQIGSIHLKKRPRKPGTGIKESSEEMEHEFLFETFRPWKQDYLFRRSVAPENFPLKRPVKSCFIYFLT